jgi:hypothetical protein
MPAKTKPRVFRRFFERAEGLGNTRPARTAEGRSQRDLEAITQRSGRRYSNSLFC